MLSYVSSISIYFFFFFNKEWKSFRRGISQCLILKNVNHLSSSDRKKMSNDTSSLSYRLFLHATKIIISLSQTSSLTCRSANWLYKYNSQVTKFLNALVLPDSRSIYDVSIYFNCFLPEFSYNYRPGVLL